MVVMDFVIIGVALLFIILGLVLGFGKILEIFTSGIFGIIISIVVCYFIFGMVMNIPFVQTLLAKFVAKVSGSENAFVKLLLKIRIDAIALGIVLFILVQIVRIIIVAIIKGVMEAESPVMKFINKTLGVIVNVGIAIALMLIVFQIIYMVQGTEGNVYAAMEGSFFRLDKLYTHNPLNAMVDNLIKA